MPGIPSALVLQRRQALAKMLPDDSLVVIPGYKLRYATGPVL